jgi:uncharacterized iron-regulated membrane protein
MKFLRWSVRIHKWVALLVGIQIALWIAGGLVMSAIPIERVRGEHKIAERALPSLDPENLLPLRDAASRAGLDTVNSATLGHLLDMPVWRVSTSAEQIETLNAVTGERLSPIDETLARAVALWDYAETSDIAQVSWIETPPSEYGRPGPVWQVRFADGDRTTLYIDPGRAEVLARRSTTWRFYDFFWKLHVMDYDDGADFNHPLLITAAGAAVFVALSGLILLIIKFRRSILVFRQKVSQRRPSS